MESKIVVQCSCGKQYHVPAEKAGKKLRCRECGGVFVASPQGNVAPVEHAAPVTCPSTAAVAPPSAGEPFRPKNIDISALDLTPVDPAALLAPLARNDLPMLILISFAVQAAIILLTSIGHIGNMIHYRTFYPKPIMKEEAKRKAEEEMERKRQEEQKKAMEAKAKTEEEAKKAGKGERVEGEKKGESEERLKTPIEKRIEEKDMTRPTEGTNPLEDVKSLE